MKAALGKIILTPPPILGGYIGRTMAGYTPIPKINGKYDDIYGHAALIEEIYLGNIRKHVLLISTDFLQLPLLFTDYVKDKIQEAYNIHPNQILIHATHTHKSMDMTGMFAFGGNYPGLIKGIIRGSFYKWNDQYKVWIAKQIVKLVGQLLGELQPAKIAWSQKILDHAIVRNRVTHSRSDQPMNIISFKNSETDKIFGLISNFGCHPTTLGHNDKKLSAGYPGQVTKRIKELSNGEIEPIFFTGPAGNMGPMFKAVLERLDGPFYYKNEEGKTVRKSNYVFTKALGSIIGEFAYDMVKEIPDEEYFSQLEFRSYVKKFWIPMKDYSKHWINGMTRFNNAFVHWVKKNVIIPLAIIMADQHKPNFPGFAIKHKHRNINLYSIVQYIQFEGKKNNKEKANFSIVGVPGELFDDYSKKMYKNSLSSDKNTFIFQASNDWVAYLFPISFYISQGGYEPLASFAPLCGAYVFNNFIKLVEEIKTDITAGFY